MRIGVPKEIKTLEFRVGMTPAGVHEVVHDGHEVFVETNAGMGIGVTDADYEAAGATVLVQEAFRSDAVPPGLLSDPAALAAYHSEVGAIGEMAVRAGVGALMLTHLIPPPGSEEEKAGFVDDVRAAGYQGPVVVADDLNFVEVATRRRPEEPAT